MSLRRDLAASLLLEAAKAHIAARDALNDVPTQRLSVDDPRFAAVTDTLDALRGAVATAEAACGVRAAPSLPSPPIAAASVYEHDARFADVIRASDHPRLPDMGMRLCLQPQEPVQHFAEAVLAHVAAMQIAALEARGVA